MRQYGGGREEIGRGRGRKKRKNSEEKVAVRQRDGNGREKSFPLTLSFLSLSPPPLPSHFSPPLTSYLILSGLLTPIPFTLTPAFSPLYVLTDHAHHSDL